MTTKELLRRKAEGAAWTRDEMTSFVLGVVSGAVSTAQAAAFLMAARIHGLTTPEIVALTQAMAESGARLLPLNDGIPSIDKHSTGGVGDKVSLCLVPIAVAGGLRVPMISGRGLGHTGGTVDKLESIAGFRTALSIDEMDGYRRTINMFMAAQSDNIAPADKILYALRDVTGTVEAIGLLTSSILSKKFAEGLDGLVMDMKVGSAAFMPTLREAELLGESIRTTAEAAGILTDLVYSSMSQPLGRSVGNWVEVVEARDVVQGHGPSDVTILTIELAARMFKLGNIVRTVEDGRDYAQHLIQSGSAYTVFMDMVGAQGGDWNRSEERFSTAAFRTIVAENTGYLAPIDARSLALAVNTAGAGRFIEGDTIEPDAGLVLHVDIGGSVRRGDVIATVTARDENKLSILWSDVSQLLNITSVQPDLPSTPIIA